MCLLAHNSILFTTAWPEQYVSACSHGIDPSCLCEHNGAGLEHGKGVDVADAAHNSPYPQSDRKVRVNSISRGLEERGPSRDIGYHYVWYSCSCP